MPPNYQNQNPQPFNQPPVPGGNNPFDFITNSPQAPKHNFLNNGSKKTRIIIVAGMLIAVIILIIIGISIFTGGDKAKTAQLIEVAKTQTEIIRLGTLGEQNAQSLETRSYASTIKLSMISSQSATNRVITSNGVKQKALSKQLSASRNTKSDQLLTEAKQNNRYDSTFTELINKELTSYKQKLSNSASALSANEKALLQEPYNQVDILQRPSN